VEEVVVEVVGEVEEEVVEVVEVFLLFLNYLFYHFIILLFYYFFFLMKKGHGGDRKDKEKEMIQISANVKDKELLAAFKSFSEILDYNVTKKKHAAKIPIFLNSFKTKKFNSFKSF